MTTQISDLVSAGPLAGALRAVIYGPEGVGKTTLASLFPQAVILDLEGSSDTYDLNRIEVNTLQQYHEVIDRLIHEGHPFQTMAIDSISKLESWLEDKICTDKKKARIADFGWGDGYTLVREEFEDELSVLDELIRKGLNVILLGHSIVKRKQPPELSEGFDRYELGIAEKAAAVVKRWAKVVLVLSYRTTVSTNDQKKTFGIGGEKRIICTRHTAAFDAKNRHDLEAEIPFENKTELPAGLAPLFTLTPALISPALFEKFSELTAGIHPEVLKAFLIHRGELGRDAELPSLRPFFLERVIAEPERFAQVVEDWAREQAAEAAKSAQEEPKEPVAA